MEDWGVFRTLRRWRTGTYLGPYGDGGLGAYLGTYGGGGLGAYLGPYGDGGLGTGAYLGPYGDAHITSPSRQLRCPCTPWWLRRESHLCPV